MSELDLRHIAERWISEYGSETPEVVRTWARQLDSAPTAAGYLVAIADIAGAILAEQSAGLSKPSDLPMQPVR